MNDDDVRKQLSSMVSFIQQEAEEKAQEILSKAREDFQTEKKRMADAGRKKIDKEFEDKETEFEIAQKILASTEMNLGRLRVLKARDDGIQDILNEALNRQHLLSRPGAQYSALLQKLILQGFLKLREAEVIIVCRKEDVAAVEEAAALAGAEFKKVTQSDVSATISKKLYLAPGKTGNAPSGGQFCTGGVMLTSQGGRIVCSNTLDDRLALVYQSRLPVIREMLFGANPNRKFFD